MLEQVTEIVELTILMIVFIGIQLCKDIVTVTMLMTRILSIKDLNKIRKISINLNGLIKAEGDNSMDIHDLIKFYSNKLYNKEEVTCFVHDEWLTTEEEN